MQVKQMFAVLGAFLSLGGAALIVPQMIGTTAHVPAPIQLPLVLRMTA